MPVETEEARTAVAWPDTADEIFASDQTVALARVTPAGGVTLTPLTNFAVRDRDRAALSSVNTSIGIWKKLVGLQQRPHVALAYHTRRHSFTTRPEYVLVQGTASVPRLDDPGWIDRHRPNWERFAGPRDVGRWEWWLRHYHWRVPIDIAVERVTVWPDLACRGAPEVHGRPPGEPPASQRPPGKGRGPRLNHGRAARISSKLPHVLLGWVGSDDLPVVVPVTVEGVEAGGILLRAGSGLVPAGSRRAGLLAHRFSRHSYGQRQRKYTGWLEVDAGGERLLYRPHTKHGYDLPRFAFKLAAGAGTQLGYYDGRRKGILAA